jgi:putative heme iron utilization protein
MLKSTVRALQAMLDQQRILTLAVQTAQGPYAGLLPFVPVAEYSAVLVHASKLARHTHGLTAGAQAGILVHEQDGPGKDPLQIERLMLDCTVQPFERKSAECEAGRELYLARFPDSRITFKLGDFTLYRLQFVAGTYVAGFGRAMNIEPRDIRRLAEPV